MTISTFSPSLSASPVSPLLGQARDAMARLLRETARAWLASVANELGAEMDRAEEVDRRRFLHQMCEMLTLEAQRIEALLAAHWQREFDASARQAAASAAISFGLDGLSLVDEGELEEEIAIKSFGDRLREACADELNAVGRRLVACGARSGEVEQGAAAAPVVLARVLAGALREAGFAAPMRRELLRRIAPQAQASLPAAYAELNSFFIRHGVLPEIKRGYAKGEVKRSPTEKKAAEGKPAIEGDVFAMLAKLVGSAAQVGAGGSGGGLPGGGGGNFPGGVPGGLSGAVSAASMPQGIVWTTLESLQRASPMALPTEGAVAVPANALREFRASSAAQDMSPLDAVTVDIVATLFDLIFEDKSIADPIKALIGRLQIPVLKVAMIDKSFFASRAHPARRLLDGISRAAVRWGRDLRRDDPLYRHVEALVDRVQQEFQQDTSLFETLCIELEQFLITEEAEADGLADRAAPLLADEDKKRAAQAEADAALAGFIGQVAPGPVLDLLRLDWRQLLVRLRLANDEEGWKEALNTAAELVDSVQAKSNPRARRVLTMKLPLLVKALQRGLERAGTATERRLKLMDDLFALHASVLRGTEPPPASAAPEEVPEPQITTSRIEQQDLQLERIALAGTSLAMPIEAEAMGRVAALKRGDWVEFYGENGSERYRLSWLSPNRGVLLFTNPRSPQALAVAPEALAMKLARGEAIEVSEDPIFERAVGRALEQLQPA